MTTTLPAFSVQQSYPGGYHATVFLYHALDKFGVVCRFQDPLLENCEGLLVDTHPVAWLLDNRIPGNRAWQDPAAKLMLDRGQLVAHCQKEDMKRVGGKWLPLAVTPGYDAPHGTAKKTHDVGFVGYVNDTERRAFLQQLTNHCDVRIESGVFDAKAIQVYHECRIGVNVPAMFGSTFAYDINMRTFEIMATGTPLVTAYNSALHELGIRDGVNCLTYTDLAGCVQAIQTLLDDVTLCDQLATNAYQLVMSWHTYKNRAEQVLRWIYER